MRAPKFASPEYPGRIGFTRLTKPVGESPRAHTRNSGASKPPKPGKPIRPASDRIATMPGKNAKPRDLLRGIGSRRVK